MITGDGELAEGSNWEAALAAAHYGLDNLVIINDKNNLQLAGPTREIMNTDPLADKWRAFGMEVDAGTPTAASGTTANSSAEGKN